MHWCFMIKRQNWKRCKMAKTYREVLSWASSFLEKQGKEGYGIEYLFLARKEWSKTQWLLQMNQPISKEEEALILSDLKKLTANQPPQYILGFEEFYGQRFKVTSDTLIPRPETEELVALCLQENPDNKNLKVTDIGTGTGAIAITLKTHRSAWQLSAIDISAAALTVACQNAKELEQKIHFYQGDTLEPIKEKQDIIISNPPYISYDEWPLMDESVREFEPKIALFAADNGLEIYQRIAKQAPDKLTANGQLYLEIGFQQGKILQKLFQQTFPDKNVRIIKDLAGQDRMIYVS